MSEAHILSIQPSQLLRRYLVTWRASVLHLDLQRRQLSRTGDYAHDQPRGRLLV
jgi:hypothetical protein